MKKVGILVLLYTLLFIPFSAFSQTGRGIRYSYYSGFNSVSGGAELNYHSCHPLARKSLLSRCSDGNMKISWSTAGQMTPDHSGKSVYTWICAFSSGTSGGDRIFDVWLDGIYAGFFKTLKDSARIIWEPANDFHEVQLDFFLARRDHVNDCHGYMSMTLPNNKYGKNGQHEISICGRLQNSNDWYMVFQYDISEKVFVTADPAILKNCEKMYREVRFIADAPYPCTRAKLSLSGVMDTTINIGFRCPGEEIPAARSVYVPLEITNNQLDFRYEVEGKTIVLPLKFDPVKIKEVYLIHHSHNDIGYTDLQPKVLDLQVENLRRAMILVKQYQSFPDGAKYKWNSEINWALAEYLARADSSAQTEIIKAVKEGFIGLNGLYTNPLTGISKAEELMRIAEECRYLQNKYGLHCRSAMISDIPGLSWAMVPALYHAGIRYLSSGPNPFDRIGWSTERLGDVPFYWISASGEEKILVWIASMGYAMFHQQNTIKGFSDFPIRLFTFIDSLGARKYPYDIAQLRVALYSDNGPTDSTLSPFVKAWNERYLYPKLRIATTDEMFDRLEKDYADKIPILKGDYTPYWEDGAISTASELGINRRNAERLIQLQMAQAIIYRQENTRPDPVPFSDALRNILLFSEHTWGAQASISNPDDLMTLEQWKYKKQYALKADSLLDQLQAAILPMKRTPYIEVINTLSVKRSGIIIIPVGKNEKISVHDEQGNEIESQRIDSAHFAFYAIEIPALGFSTFKVDYSKDKKYPSTQTSSGYEIENENLKLEINPKDGTVKSLTEKLTGQEFSAGNGLNELNYVKGLDASTISGAKLLSATILNDGPLVWHLQVKLSAGGFDSICYHYYLFKGENQLRINNIVYKTAERSKEAVYFRFPFAVSNPQNRFDAGWSYYGPGYRQLPGSCNDFYYAMRWADVSGMNKGVSLIVSQAPLLELSTITDETPHNSGPSGWKTTNSSSSVLYSYVMNNYWHTNYKADQRGRAEFGYVICPHDSFSYRDVFFAAQSFHQPLLTRFVTKKAPAQSMFDLKNDALIVTSVNISDDQKAFMICIHNTSSTDQSLKPEWMGFRPSEIYMSDILQSKSSEITFPIRVKANGILILRCDF